MAGGEAAKNSGELGEKIVARLLELFGWIMPDSGISIKCVLNKKHGDEKKSKLKHGIDNIYQYKSYLIDNTRQDVLISVKCRDKYPTTEKGVKSKFKEFYEDLSTAAECYPASELYKRKIKGTKARKIDGVIFWIDRNDSDGTKNFSLLDKLDNVRVTETAALDSLTLVDNKRAQFLFESISLMHKEYGEENVEYFYLDTGLNNSSIEREYFGKQLPIEYLSSSIIPFAVEINGSKTLILITEDPFDENYLKRLIGLAHSFTRNFSGEVVIIFPDYHDMHHKDAVRNAYSSFSSDEFIKKIKLKKMNPDFRDGVFE
ncbi:GapS4a family protein [Bacillus cereus]|uniref:GAPS4 PD-(D/E)XK nuclease domain-containing protein n=1 Tax=Bacillus cereus TaxID=1396 RepID=A0A9X6YQB7_BACCE|nr:hypothetical protein [Bacillus cereus]PEQ83389.1 hypothetical protein CN475_22875 [Bacillus cereus]